MNKEEHLFRFSIGVCSHHPKRLQYQ